MSNGNLTIYHPREAMIAFAYGLIDTVHHKLIADATDFYTTAMRKRLREGLSEREPIIAAAMNGDMLAHVCLMAEFDEWNEHHQLPPISLINYERWQRQHGPPQKHGHKWWEDEQRNIGLALVIALVGERFRIEATRNDESKTKVESACSITGAALRRRDRNLAMSEKRLNSIWNRYGEAAVFAIAAHRRPELLPHMPLFWLIRRR
jgi:hypothetical protein